MRVGIHLPLPLRAYSIDFPGFARELIHLGHDPVMICRPGGDGEFPGDVAVASETDEASPDFWRPFSLDRVFSYNWFQDVRALQAARSAGITVITRADSDGLVSSRVFPAAAWLRLVDPARGVIDAARRVPHFARWVLFHWRKHDARVLGAIDASDYVAVETEAAKRNFQRFLKSMRRIDLASRFYVAPHAVSDPFLAPPPEVTRPPTIFCGWRWDDDQKNAPLLKATVERVLDQRSDVQFVIAGPGSKSAFGTLAGRRNGVRVLGRIPQAEVRSLLCDACFLLSSSRYESQPIGALEALCCGCTVVATPVPGFEDIVAGGAFGTLASSHRTAALASAALGELDRWDRGDRQPARISSHWRAAVCNKRVAEQLMALA